VPLPFKLNQDRRHRIPRQKHRVTNSAAYDAAPAPAREPDDLVHGPGDRGLARSAAHHFRRTALVFAARHPDGAHCARAEPVSLWWTSRARFELEVFDGSAGDRVAGVKAVVVHGGVSSARWLTSWSARAGRRHRWQLRSASITRCCRAGSGGMGNWRDRPRQLQRRCRRGRSRPPSSSPCRPQARAGSAR